MSVASVTQTRQYLTFKLKDELFALDVAKVREILEVGHITRVPQAPSYVSGIINLRGSVVSVIDLGLKLGMEPTQRTIATCIIVVEVELEGEISVLGALADSVQEVFELDPGQIEPAPRLGTGINAEFLQGVGKQDDHFLLLLDIDKIFLFDEVEAIRARSLEASVGADVV